MSGRNATYAVPECSRSGTLAACAPSRRSGCLSPFMSPTPETDQPVRSSAAAPSSRRPRSPSFARSISRCGLPAEDHVHGARVVAAVLVGLLRADDDVCPAVPVEVSGAGDGARGVVELGGAVDPEASLAKRPEVDLPRPAAEDDVRGARVFPPVGIGRRRADEDVGPAVAVDVARARDRPADSAEDDLPAGVAVDLEAALTERCEVDGLRRALPEDDVGRAGVTHARCCS